MPTRAATLLLAFALFWSGMATHTPAVAEPGPGAQQPSFAAALALMVHSGDAQLTDHHAGDAPAQPLTELQADAQALLPGHDAAAVSMLTLPHPIPGLAAALATPFLAGLQRPPCPALHRA